VQSRCLADGGETMETSYHVAFPDTTLNPEVMLIPEICKLRDGESQKSQDV
jgi:hypothetical protein